MTAVISSRCVLNNLHSQECAIDFATTNGTKEAPANPIHHHKNQYGPQLCAIPLDAGWIIWARPGRPRTNA